MEGNVSFSVPLDPRAAPKPPIMTNTNGASSTVKPIEKWSFLPLCGDNIEWYLAQFNDDERLTILAELAELQNELNKSNEPRTGRSGQ